MVPSLFLPSAPARPVIDEECFVDADEAAGVLGINPKTLQRWSRQGIVPAHPIGEGRRKFWRYLISELKAWLRDRTAPAARRAS